MIAAATAPKASDSAYTAIGPSCSTTVEPEAENSGLSSEIKAMAGSCQRKPDRVAAPPRTIYEHSMAPTKDMAAKTGCSAHMLMSAMEPSNTMATAGCSATDGSYAKGLTYSPFCFPAATAI